MRVWTVILGLWLATAALWGQQLLWRQSILTGEAVVYAPNGQLLATLAAGNQVALYQSGQAVGMLRGAQEPLRAIAFSPNSALLAACDDTGGVYLWQVSNGALLWRVSAFSGRALAIAFISNGVIAVGGDGGNLQLRSATNGSLIRALAGHTTAIAALAVSPDGAELVSGDESGQARVWRVADGAILQSWQAQTGAITALARSANHTLAMGSPSGEVRLWERNNLGIWSLSRTITNAHDGDIVALAFSSTNQLYSAGGADGKVRRWDPASGAKLSEFTASLSGILSFALRPDGGQISTGVAERVVRQWGANGAPQGTLGGHQDIVSGVGFASNNLLATVSYDETLRLWQLPNGAPSGSPINLNGFISTGAVRPDGNQIAVGFFDGKIALRALPTGAMTREWNAHSDTVLCLAYAPDGSLLVSGSYDGTAKVWSVSTGALLSTFGGHTGAVHAVAVNQQYIASCDTSGQVRLWNRATGQLVQQWSAHSDIIQAVAFSPNGALLATGGQDGFARIWNTDSGALLHELGGHGLGVVAVLFPSDNWLLTVDGEGWVRLYAADTGEQVGQWQFTQSRIEAVAYQSASNLLAVVGDEGVLLYRFSGAPNRPPSAPQLLAPDDGAQLTTRTPTFRVRATDPDNHAVRVEVEIAVGSGARVLQSELNNSGAEFALTPPTDAPLLPGSHTWRARAIDEFGAESSWSAPRTFTIVNQAPNTPELLEPEDGAPTSALPTFRARLTDPDGDRCRLVVRIRGANNFERTQESGLVASGGEAQITLTQALSAGTYTWQAKARDEHNAESDWSAERTFTVPANRAPEVPELLEPEDGAATSATPTFQVRLSDPDDDRVKAILEIALSDGSTRTLETVFVNSGATVQASVPSSQPLPAGAHRWRARAQDNRDAQSDWSAWRNFQASDDSGGGDNDGGDNPPTNRPPSTPTLLAPSPNATTSATPTFKLQASDPDGDTLRYEIEVSVGHRQFNFALDSSASGAVACFQVPTAQALPAGAASWRARAIDSRNAASDWSEPQPFTVSSALPSQLQGVLTFGLGLNLPDATPAALGLQDVRIVEWNPATQQYQDASQLRIGRGYFLKADAPVQPDLSGAPITSEIRIPLQTGWNLISHPYLAPLAWDETAIRVVQGGETRTLREASRAGWLERYAWVWDAPQRRYRLMCDPRALPNALTELPPFFGAWILAWQPCELVLNPTTRAASGRVHGTPPSGWTLRVQASVGSASDEAVVGVGEPLQASAPPDAPDTPAPVQIHLKRAAQSLSADIRRADARAEWTLEVAVAPADGAQVVELHFPDLVYLPRRATLALYDEQSQRTFPLRTRARYAFTAPPEGGVFRFRIQQERARTPLQILQPSALGGRNAGGVYTLQATLTAPAQVQFEIRAAGRTVRTLPVQTTRASGIVQVVWDGRDDIGRALPPGSYQAHIVAQSDDGQLARAVVPILITR